MKTNIIKRALVAMAVVAASIIICAQAQTKVSVLGDSYSTFADICTPVWSLTWYGPGCTDGAPVKNNDVTEVDQTWWAQFIGNNGYVLEKNNSFSGSTICLTGYSAKDYADRAFITRIFNLGDPDVILVFGGTNDSWARSPIGEYKYADWTRGDLYTFRPAFAYLLENLKSYYPEAQIYNLTNSQLSDDITTSMQEICDHYGVPNVQLHDIDKQQGHPSQAGMRAIAEQLQAVYDMKNKE